MPYTSTQFIINIFSARWRLVEDLIFALQTGDNSFRRTATDSIIIQMKTDLINGRVHIEKLGQRNRNNPVSFCPKHTG